MSKIGDIAEGFVNYSLSYSRTNSHEIELEARRRMEICALCPDRSNLWCQACGCYLPAKIRSGSECPREKW